MGKTSLPFCMMQNTQYTSVYLVKSSIFKALQRWVQFTDEPTGNLDSKTSQEVMGLLKMTSREFNQTVIMITHNEEIAQLADRTIHIEDGKIVGGEA